MKPLTLLLIALVFLPRPAAASLLFDVPSNCYSYGFYPGDVMTITQSLGAGTTGLMLFGYQVGTASDQAYFLNSPLVYSGPVPAEPPGAPWVKLPVYQGDQGSGFYVSTDGQAERDLQFVTYASPYAAVLVCALTGATPLPTSTPQPATSTPTSVPASPTPTSGTGGSTPTSDTGGSTATPTPGYPSNAGIQIIYVEPQLDGGGSTDEYVLIRNFDTVGYDLTGWTLEDVVGHQYTFSFSAFSLPAGGHVRVWTRGGGTNTANDLYWGRGSAIWNNTGDSALLRDGSGALRAQYDYSDNACDGLDVAKSPSATTLTFVGSVQLKALVGDLTVDGRLLRSWWPSEAFAPGSYSASAADDTWGAVAYGIVKVCQGSAPTATSTAPPATATSTPPSASPTSSGGGSTPTAGALLPATPPVNDLWVLPNTPAPFIPGPAPTFSAGLPNLQPLPTRSGVSAGVTTTALVGAAQQVVSTAVAPVEQFTSWSDSLGLQGWDAGAGAAAPVVEQMGQAIGMLAIIGQLLPILPILLLPFLVIIIRAVLSLVKYVKQIIPFQ